jgi:MFS family permease
MLIIQLPFLLEAVAGASATQSGLVISGAILFSISPSLMFGRINRRLSIFTIVTLGFILFGIGYPIIGLGTGLVQIFVGAAIAGLGLGLLMPTLNVWLVARAPEVFRGRAFGLLTTSISLGQFISPIVTEPISSQMGIGGSFVVVGAVMLAVAAAFFVGGRINSEAKSLVPSQQV